MKLATFSGGGEPRLGLVLGDELIDLAAVCPSLPRDMVAFLAGGPGAMEQARAASQSPHRRPLTEVRLHAPILNPPEFIIAGVNYADHIAEGRDGKTVTPLGLDKIFQNPTAKPEVPIVTNKQSSCIVGPRDNIHLPSVSSQLDYEAELAFVIGRPARHVSPEQAPDFIAGYLVANDVSVRDWQFKSPTHTLGKSFDTHGPIGPWLVTPDEVGDPHDLAIRCWVNDELRQDSSTKYMITNCFEILAALSTVFTLRPGTIVSTGTPAGCGIGFDPPRYLRVGDVVRTEIERIGEIVNTVVAEPVAA